MAVARHATNGVTLSAVAVCALLAGCVVNVDSLTRGLPGAAGASGSAGSASAAGAGGSGQATAGQGGQPAQAGNVGNAGEAPLGTAGASAAGSGNGGGSGGAAPTCVPRAEICNGIDDDCDGTVDDGCPASVAWTLSQATHTLGDSPGGDAFGDQCDTGEVLTGIDAGFALWLDQIRGVCSKVEIKPVDANKAPYVYTLALTSPHGLAAHPDTTTSSVAPLACPTNQVLVGMRIAQQNFDTGGGVMSVVTPRIWITCAELVLKTAASGYSLDWQNPSEVGPLSGSAANDTAWFAQGAAAPAEVAVRLTGSAGSWLDRVGFVTGVLRVVRR